MQQNVDAGLRMYKSETSFTSSMNMGSNYHSSHQLPLSKRNEELMHKLVTMLSQTFEYGNGGFDLHQASLPQQNEMIERAASQLVI